MSTLTRHEHGQVGVCSFAASACHAIHPRKGALRERLQQARASRETWTAKHWERVVKQIREEDWGVVAHGGARPKKAIKFEHSAVGEGIKLEHSAVGEHAIVASAFDGKPMAKVPSDVVERTHSAVGEKQREVGQMAGSAVGEEQARDGDRSLLRVAEKQIAGYRVTEIINCGSFGDVYKAVNNSSGELFAIKVMQK